MAFESDWFATIGGFLGALVLDGTSLASADPRFQAQTPVDGIRDLQGNVNKKFGMRFNGFGGLADRLTAYTTTRDAELLGQGKKIKYYHTVPLLWTVGKTGDSLSLGLGAASGRYAQYVRVK